MEELSEDARLNLEQQKQKLRKELTEVEAQLLRPSKDTIKNERDRLRKWYCIVLGTLFVTLVASLLALLYFCESYTTHNCRIYALAVLAGVAGSSVSALVSANKRYAAGLEFKDGTRYPDQDDKKERFNSRLIGGFLTRPFLGGAMGPLIILFLNTKIFGDIDLCNPAGMLPVVLLWSALGGLFAKTLLDKLKDVFANLIGAKN